MRSDNSPTQFGIDFLGCSSGATITLNYYYKNVLYQAKYSCTTSLTQQITIPGTKTFAYSTSGKVVTFNRTSLASNLPSTFSAYPVDASGVRIGSLIPLTVTNGSSGTFTANIDSLGTGKYGFRSAYTNTNGFGDVKSYVEITQDAAPTLLANVESGFGGGALLTVQGTGLSSFNRLYVKGIRARLVTSSLTENVYSAPALVTATSQASYKLAHESVLKGTIISDTATNKSNPFDQLMSTKYSSNSSTCYIGYDFGENEQALITKIRYFPNPLWKSAIAYIGGATVKVSNDGTTYTPILTIDSTTHTGWNVWRPAATPTQAYRYVRFEHNSTSKCELAEFEVSGYLYATDTATTRDVVFTNGASSTTFTAAVTYKAESTPVVSGVSPKFASPAGGDTLTITGSGFGTTTSSVSVVIDEITCTVTAVTDTQITCTTGARPNLPTTNSFVVTISGNSASVQTNGFLYGHRWSDELTWGGDFAPIDDDSVYVPKGMVLIVDQTTPNLYLILVEGSIVFADEADMTIETTFLIVENGVFRAGT